MSYFFQALLITISTVVHAASLNVNQSSLSLSLNGKCDSSAQLQVLGSLVYGETFWGRPSVYLQYSQNKIQGFAGGTGQTNFACAQASNTSNENGAQSITHTKCSGILGSVNTQFDVGVELSGPDRLVTYAGRIGSVNFVVKNNFYGSWQLELNGQAYGELIFDGEGKFAGKMNSQYAPYVVDLDVRISPELVKTIDDRILFLMLFAPLINFDSIRC
jgi:hypothetical protein